MPRAHTSVVCLTLTVLALSCNAVIGADEPVVDEPSKTAGSSEPGRADEPEDNPRIPACGDGLIEGEEQCDDANDAVDDGCVQCEVRCGQAPELLVERTLHCYRFGSGVEAKTWDQAVAVCTAWGGFLVTLSDEAEYNAVQNRVHMDAWVGARFDAAAGTFKWTNGERFEANAWTAPLATGVGDCVAFSAETSGLARFSCDAPLDFVCERPPPGVRAE